MDVTREETVLILEFLYNLTCMVITEHFEDEQFIRNQPFYTKQSFLTIEVQPITKADLYIRVSTDDQADRRYSQRDQEERLKHYC